jgi:hypothetical protein
MLFTPRTTNAYWIVHEVDPTNLVEWVDYIPLQTVTEVAAGVDRYEENGHIPVEQRLDVSALTAWVDYTPIDFVTLRAGKWRIEADGFIPVVDKTS